MVATNAMKARRYKLATLEARRAITRLIRVTYGLEGRAPGRLAREWVEAILDDPEAPESEEYDSGGEIFGEGEDQISRDSAMFREK